ncbi:DEAD/DEAH box helicase [Lentisphaerota bacterium ZTH]|nr:DEAD/DEAH box helicase [Lentisphaerota bacterium]WET06176.1 DEAD/DEAH box helicase [Lentisphaerota bacterium ZTH]
MNQEKSEIIQKKAIKTKESCLNGFTAFGLEDEIYEGVLAAGFKTPSEIQEQAIPPVLEGRDVIAQAHTGTGKTAAFSLPAMSRMYLDRGVEMLVLTPTRELAIQVSDEIYRLGRYAGVRTGTVCGGQSYHRQITMINRGINVVVATPGRMLDLLTSGSLSYFEPSVVVLDEADEMLDMGFLDDIKEIYKFLPDERQNLLFSATMPPQITKLAKTILKDPVVIKTVQDDGSTNSDIEQQYCVIEENEREDAIIRLIEDQCPAKAMLFCRTRTEVDRLSCSLGARGFNTKPLHGDMEQAQRNEVMQGFRKGLIDILVATDVASRGLDVSDVSHVFNYHMPFDTKSYIHRIGRTGRAGQKGIAITLVTPREYRQMGRIRKQTGAEIRLSSIPTLKEMRLNRAARLKQDLCEHKPLKAAEKLIRSLEETMSTEEIALKLASMILSEQAESGPEFIGLSRSRLERIIADEKRDRRQRRKDKFAKRFKGKKPPLKGSGKSGSKNNTPERKSSSKPPKPRKKAAGKSKKRK